MRYGNRMALGKQWTACGTRPSGVSELRRTAHHLHIGYDYGYLYAALCPQTGDLFALLLPTMESACYQVFLNELDAHLQIRQTGSVRLVMDNAGTHHSTQFNRPSGIESCYLPAYSPELNPCERFFEELRRKLKGQVFETVDQVEAALTDCLNPYWQHPDSIRSLTLWDWMKPTSKPNPI
jgi:transposase